MLWHGVFLIEKPTTEQYRSKFTKIGCEASLRLVTSINVNLCCDDILQSCKTLLWREMSNVVSIMFTPCLWIYNTLGKYAIWEKTLGPSDLTPDVIRLGVTPLPLVMSIHPSSMSQLKKPDLERKSRKRRIIQCRHIGKRNREIHGTYL